MGIIRFLFRSGWWWFTVPRGRQFRFQFCRQFSDFASVISITAQIVDFVRIIPQIK